MSLLTCQNVSFAYEGELVLSNINFTVEQGDYLCIVGENGAGKSTLMKGILNLKKPSQGSIFTGEGLVQSEIGYLPQQTNVQRDFPASVYEVVRSGRLNALGHRLFYTREDARRTKASIAQLGLSQLKKKCYRELSGGQQQRVLLARALCSTSKILMLDEPVTGLDPKMTAELYELIYRLNKEKKITIIMVSHDIKGSIGYATHILHLGKEQLFYGKKENYVKSDLGRAFLGISDKCGSDREISDQDILEQDISDQDISDQGGAAC